jgi:hypothetical protein
VYILVTLVNRWRKTHTVAPYYVDTCKCKTQTVFFSFLASCYMLISLSGADCKQKGPITLSYTLIKLNPTRDFSQHASYPHQQSIRTCNYSQLVYVIMIVISSSTNMYFTVHIDVSSHSLKLTSIIPILMPRFYLAQIELWTVDFPKFISIWSHQQQCRM